MQLDKEYSKEQILTFYINKVFMGYGTYGMETAAKYYYGKSLKNLDLAQTAMIAGIPNAPSTYNPYSSPKLATQRRNDVLDAMVANKKISQAQANEAKQEDVTDGLVQTHEQESTTSQKAKAATNTWGAKEVFTTPKSTRGTWYYKEKGNLITLTLIREFLLRCLSAIGS